MTIAELKQALDDWRTKQRRGPYPRELRESILEYAKRRKGQQASETVVARELGIKQETLSTWLKRERASKRSGALVPVQVVASAAVDCSSEPVVVELGPMRIRGLDVDKLAILVRRLM